MSEVYRSRFCDSCGKLRDHSDIAIVEVKTAKKCGYCTACREALPATVQPFQWVKPPWLDGKTAWSWPKEGQWILTLNSLPHAGGSYQWYKAQIYHDWQKESAEIIAIARIPAVPQEVAE